MCLTQLRSAPPPAAASSAAATAATPGAGDGTSPSLRGSWSRTRGSRRPSRDHPAVGLGPSHDEVEVLFESYLQEVVSSLSALEALRFSIDNTEKFVSFRLDSARCCLLASLATPTAAAPRSPPRSPPLSQARNRLLKIDVIATAISMTMGIGAVVTGVFGMNLKFPQYIHREDDEHPGVAFNQARAPPPPAVATARRATQPRASPRTTTTRGRRRWRRSAASSSSSS